MTEADARLVEASLQAVADSRGDPAADVYAMLFAAHPELQSLFVMDRDGGVRASMLQQALECILDQTGGGRMALQIIAASRMHHEGYGVPAGRFDAFFPAIRDTFRSLLGPAWSPELDRAWGAMLAEFAAAR